MIYLDYNATTPLAPEARDAMLPYLGRLFGNPSSIHAAGRMARAAIDDARDRMAKILEARPHEIIFTGGGTESDNLGVIGLARQRKADGNHLVTCVTEHHAIIHAFEYLEAGENFRITWLPVDHCGAISLEDLKAALTPETTLVSVMSANNETGTLQPVSGIAAICRERGILYHCDMVQSFGKLPLDVATAGPDAISISAHKFNGPKGTGLLWLRAGVPIRNILHGGFHENERRPGTENIAGIVGMTVAAELSMAGIESARQRQEALRCQLWDGIRSAFPEAWINGHPTLRLANTLNVTFPGIDGESLLINLDLEGIGASSGAACMVGSIQPSHVLLAMGVEPEHAKSSIRFSIGKQTTEEEIVETIEKLPRIFERLKK